MKSSQLGIQCPYSPSCMGYLQFCRLCWIFSQSLQWQVHSKIYKLMWVPTLWRAGGVRHLMRPAFSSDFFWVNFLIRCSFCIVNWMDELGMMWTPTHKWPRGMRYPKRPGVWGPLGPQKPEVPRCSEMHPPAFSAPRFHNFQFKIITFFPRKLCFFYLGKKIPQNVKCRKHWVFLSSILSF